MNDSERYKASQGSLQQRKGSEQRHTAIPLPNHPPTMLNPYTILQCALRELISALLAYLATLAVWTFLWIVAITLLWRHVLRPDRLRTALIWIASCALWFAGTISTKLAAVNWAAAFEATLAGLVGFLITLGVSVWPLFKTPFSSFVGRGRYDKTGRWVQNDYRIPMKNSQADKKQPSNNSEGNRSAQTSAQARPGASNPAQGGNGVAAAAEHQCAGIMRGGRICSGAAIEGLAYCQRHRP